MHNTSVTLLINATLTAGIAMLWVMFVLRFIYNYRFTGSAVEVVLFHAIPVYRIPVANIKWCRKASWRELGLGGLTLRLGNRLVSRCVLIEKRTGWLRHIVITPSDPDGFTRLVNGARRSRGGDRHDQ
jgi:hypothetical protein